jgi:hypothetical protein
VAGSGTNVGGTNFEIDEFWRMFGDSMGRRQVDATDLFNFAGTNGSSSSNSAATASITSSSQASNGVVTITTSAANGFLVGEVVNILLPNGFKGSFVIQTVNTSNNTFTFTTSINSLANYSSTTSPGTATLNPYLWYFDSNEDGNIDVGNSLDQTQLVNRLFTRLAP